MAERPRIVLPAGVLPNDLLAILVCPKSKQPLLYFPRGETGAEADGFLLCVVSRLRYRVEAGVPVMLVEEAIEVAQDVVDRLVQSSDVIQRR